MAAQNRWWRGDTRERFWLEATRRRDIGADLKAPVGLDGSDKAWRYELFKEAAVGDVVYHYDGNVGAITAVSRIAGPWAPRPIIWAARGTSARSRGEVPTEMDGYFMPIDRHWPLTTPLSLAGLQERNQTLRTITAALRQEMKTALYFPFELSGRPGPTVAGVCLQASGGDGGGVSGASGRPER